MQENGERFKIATRCSAREPLACLAFHETLSLALPLVVESNHILRTEDAENCAEMCAMKEKTWRRAMRLTRTNVDARCLMACVELVLRGKKAGYYFSFNVFWVNMNRGSVDSIVPPPPEWEVDWSWSEWLLKEFSSQGESAIGISDGGGVWRSKRWRRRYGLSWFLCRLGC